MLGQGEFLDDEGPDRAEALRTIDAVLTRHGVERLPPTVLTARIDPILVIDTTFGDPPFAVVDAWFHWWHERWPLPIRRSRREHLPAMDLDGLARHVGADRAPHPSPPRRLRTRPLARQSTPARRPRH